MIEDHNNVPINIVRQSLAKFECPRTPTVNAGPAVYTESTAYLTVSPALRLTIQVFVSWCCVVSSAAINVLDLNQINRINRAYKF